MGSGGVTWARGGGPLGSGVQEKGGALGSGGDFLEKSKILAGRLPPEDGSDRRETLGKRVSDDFAKMIFRGQKFSGGSIFRKNSLTIDISENY